MTEKLLNLYVYEWVEGDVVSINGEVYYGGEKRRYKDTLMDHPILIRSAVLKLLCEYIDNSMELKIKDDVSEQMFTNIIIKKILKKFGYSDIAIMVDIHDVNIKVGEGAVKRNIEYLYNKCINKDKYSLIMNKFGVVKKVN